MTRKQYEAKVRQLQRNIARYAKETHGKHLANADRVNIPTWGTVIEIGKHKGEILRSYEQVWDTMSEALKGSVLLEGIE